MRTALTRLLRRLQRTQTGFVTTEFVLGVAFLILPVTMLVISLPAWAERQSNARVASREAALTYVLTGSQDQARQTVVQMAQNQGIDPAKIRVSFEGDPLVAGSEVRATVTSEVSALSVPLLDSGIGSFELSDSHTEIVDLYRSQPR